MILVMGISAAVPITGIVVSSFKYGGTTPTNVEPTKETPPYQFRKIYQDSKQVLWKMVS